MATYTVNAASGSVDIEADSITATTGGPLSLFKTGQTEPVAVFTYWNYYIQKPEEVEG